MSGLIKTNTLTSKVLAEGLKKIVKNKFYFLFQTINQSIKLNENFSVNLNNLNLN